MIRSRQRIFEGKRPSECGLRIGDQAYTGVWERDEWAMYRWEMVMRAGGLQKRQEIRSPGCLIFSLLVRFENMKSR